MEKLDGDILAGELNPDVSLRPSDIERQPNSAPQEKGIHV